MSKRLLSLVVWVVGSSSWELVTALLSPYVAPLPYSRALD